MTADVLERSCDTRGVLVVDQCLGDAARHPGVHEPAILGGAAHALELDRERLAVEAALRDRLENDVGGDVAGVETSRDPRR